MLPRWHLGMCDQCKVVCRATWADCFDEIDDHVQGVPIPVQEAADPAAVIVDLPALTGEARAAAMTEIFPLSRTHRTRPAYSDFTAEKRRAQKRVARRARVARAVALYAGATF